jgi:ATP-dependent DNA helicase RecG
MTIEQLLRLKETEDKVEFKEAKGGNYSYSGGNKSDPKDRRRCILGYISALANEGGGYLAFGITDKEPHCVVGTKQSINEIGRLEQNIYNDLKIRIKTDELYDEN